LAIVWGLEVRDAASSNTNRVADAMQSAAAQAKVLGGAMNAAQAALTNAAATGDVARVQQLTTQVTALKIAYKQVEPALVQYQAEQKAATEAAKAAAVEAKRVADAQKRAMNELADAIADAIEKSKELQRNGAIALGSIAAAGVAVGAILYEGAKTALEASENVKRLTATFDALGPAGTHSGAAMVGALRQLEKEIPENEATITSWARQLEAAGDTDWSSLRGSLKAVAGAEALVEGGGQRVQDVLTRLSEQALAGGGKVRFTLTQLAGTGISETEFLSALGMTPANFAAARKAGTLTGQAVHDAIVKSLSSKSTGALAAQMGELHTLASKAADGAKRLFEQVDTEPFTAGVQHLFDIFDTAQPSGQVMQAAITGAFNAIFKVAAKVTEFIRVAFLHVVIAGLQLAILIKHHKDLFIAFAAVLAGTFLGAMASLVALTWGYVAAAGAAAVATIVATWPFLAIGAAVGLVVFAIYELIKHWSQVKEFFINMAQGAIEAATNFVEGLVNGIENGVARAVNAAKHLGSEVLGALKGLLGIHSPSAVLFDVGANVSAGFSGGIEAGVPDVQSAASSLGSAAVPSGGGGRGGAAGGPSIEVNVNIDGFHIDASHAGSPGELRQIVAEELASLAEKIGLMVGASPPVPQG
jgi:hypothetical protein